MARLVAERSDILPVLGEVFREHGVEGASLSIITKATGLGKGSLYHFFPGGKEEMVEAVLTEIHGWFEREVFAPLEQSGDAAEAVDAMFDAVLIYFNSGQRVCLVGALALSNTRDTFADAIRQYFKRWVTVLARTLERLGHSKSEAKARAEDMVLAIQGALVLARASNDGAIFKRAIKRLRLGGKPT